MTEQTRGLISSFAQEQDIIKVPEIILRLQEEDNVATVLRYKNCFKAIRNMAAHEPSTLCEQLASKENRGNQRIVLRTKDEKVVVVDMLAFIVWMFDMYLQTEEAAYLAFVKAVMELLYPNAIKRFSLKQPFLFTKAANGGMLDTYVKWVEFLYEHYGIVKPISIYDPYITNLYRENFKVFWKVAVPDLMSMACFLFTDNVDLTDIRNVNYFIAIRDAREGLADE